MYHTFCRVTLSFNHCHVAARRRRRHRRCIDWAPQHHTPSPKAINPQTRHSHIFISDLFIFKSRLLKVTKEQKRVWRERCHDSTTRCVKREQLWSSALVIFFFFFLFSELRSLLSFASDKNLALTTGLSNKDFSASRSNNVSHGEVNTGFFNVSFVFIKMKMCLFVFQCVVTKLLLR